jgi:hypothetical protein
MEQWRNDDKKISTVSLSFSCRPTVNNPFYLQTDQNKAMQSPQTLDHFCYMFEEYFPKQFL